MAATRHFKQTVGWEIIWWVVVITLAGMLVMLLATRPAAAGEGGGPPRLVPALAETWAEAVVDFRQGRFDEAMLKLEYLGCDMGDTRRGGVVDEGLRLWTILADQAGGRYEAAVAGWGGAALPAESEVWRHVGPAAAWLELGNVEAASAALDNAWRVGADHPLVHYYTGLLNLEASDQAIEWYDAVDGRAFMLAAHVSVGKAGRPQVVPNSRSMFRMVAAVELERAIERSGELEVELPLIPSSWTAEPALVPTVRDVLVALGAERYVGRAHYTLGSLMAERGQPELAEGHLDAARHEGVRVLLGYEEVARLYEGTGRHFEAARAQAKQLGTGSGGTGTVLRMMGNLERAVRDALLR